MNRCELAVDYHHRGFNCAQSVLAAFGDLTRLPEREALALAGGFGGGVGGTHEELCGALSGGVLAAGILLAPHVRENDPEGKKRAHAAARELRSRFAARFGDRTCCGDLLRADLPKIGAPCITGHCDTLIYGAVELLEEMLSEQGTAAGV